MCACSNLYKCSLKFNQIRPISILWDASEYNSSTVCSQLESSGAVRSRLMRAVGGGGEVSVRLIMS